MTSVRSLTRSAGLMLTSTLGGRLGPEFTIAASTLGAWLWSLTFGYAVWGFPVTPVADVLRDVEDHEDGFAQFVVGLESLQQAVPTAVETASANPEPP